jgi:transcriptional regulator with XRE-family HTH domain
MAERGISQNRLASRLGELPDGRIFDATQIRLIREGRRRLDRELVQRLIELLDIDWAEGWATSGLLPPGMTADHLRKLDLVATGSKKVLPGTLRSLYIVAGQSARATIAQPPELVLAVAA